MADEDPVDPAETERRMRLEAAAKRALAEADARRAEQGDSAEEQAGPTELGGRDGPEPTRFGDWEKKGIISDF